MSELKACPFAGNGVSHYVECQVDGDFAWVECSCGASSRTVIVIGTVEAKIEAASRVWNTRPMEDALLKRAEAAEAKVAELREAVRWIPTTEKLPKINEKVLVCLLMPDQYVHSGFLYMRSKEFVWDVDGFCFDGDDYDRITHWMPLPKPPKEDVK